MKTEKQDGGAAFPQLSNLQPIKDAAGNYVAVAIADEAARICGMTLRDYFAAQALPSLLQRYVADPAAAAYEMADAMIAVRSRQS